MFLEEFIIGAKLSIFSLPDVNRQFIVNCSTHESEGLASVLWDPLLFLSMLVGWFNMPCFFVVLPRANIIPMAYSRFSGSMETTFTGNKPWILSVKIIPVLKEIKHLIYK